MQNNTSNFMTYTLAKQYLCQKKQHNDAGLQNNSNR